MRSYVGIGIALLALSTFAGSAFATGLVSEPIERSPDMVAQAKHTPKVKKTKAHNKPEHIKIFEGPQRVVREPKPPHDPTPKFDRRPASLDRPEKESDTYIEIMRYWVHEKFPDLREYTRTDPNGGEPVTGAARGGERDPGEMSHSKELRGGNIGDFRHSQTHESRSSDSTKDSTSHESVGEKDTGTERDPGRGKSN